MTTSGKTVTCPNCGLQTHPGSLTRHKESGRCRRAALRAPARKERLWQLYRYTRELKYAGVPITLVETGKSRWGRNRGKPIYERWAPAEVVELATAAYYGTGDFGRDHRDGKLNMDTARILKAVWENEAMRTALFLGLEPKHIVRDTAKELGIRLREEVES